MTACSCVSVHDSQTKSDGYVSLFIRHVFSRFSTLYVMMAKSTQ